MPTFRDARDFLLRNRNDYETAYRERTIGVLAERGGRRLTAVLACRVAAFSLLDPEAQERRLARWGLVLSGAAGTPIRRLGWIERTAPAQGDELARWLHDERDPAIPLRGTAWSEHKGERHAHPTRQRDGYPNTATLPAVNPRLSGAGRP